MEADLAAGARSLALGGRLVGERAGIDERDPVVLVVIADKGDELVFVEQFGAEDGAIPLDHRRTTVGLQHQMREL